MPTASPTQDILSIILNDNRVRVHGRPIIKPKMYIINFELNGSLLISDQHVEIVYPPKVVADGRKNTKPTSNAAWPAIRLVSNDDNIGKKLHGKGMIKANKRLFKRTTVTIKYVETFSFKENCLLV